MNIFVLIKQVPDTEARIKPNAKADDIDFEGIKWILNPYDEYAVELALKIKEAAPGTMVTAVRVGATRDTEAVRTAMAMGIDEGILVTSTDNLDAFATARALKNAIEKSGKKPDLILAGRLSVDKTAAMVPPLLAAMLELPSVSVIVSCEYRDGKIIARREIEGGAAEIYELSLPCVLTCNKGLNTPRYASLPGIMKAKKKPLVTYSLSDLGLSSSDEKTILRQLRLPPQKPAGKKFVAMEDGTQTNVVRDVIKLLKEEAKVI